jgi:MarR family transcriptional regulator, organic hydroperoxide resistance regulator
MIENPEEHIVKIELLLRSVCFNIKKKGRVILEDFDISPPQFDALQYLINDGGELTIGELSSKLYLAPSTISDLVDRLEKNGLVQRIRSVEDRRIVKVKVLEKAYNLIEDVVHLRCEYINEALLEINDEKKLEFINCLSILKDTPAGT